MDRKTKDRRPDLVAEARSLQRLANSKKTLQRKELERIRELTEDYAEAKQDIKPYISSFDKLFDDPKLIKTVTDPVTGETRHVFDTSYAGFGKLVGALGAAGDIHRDEISEAFREAAERRAGTPAGHALSAAHQAVAQQHSSFLSPEEMADAFARAEEGAAPPPFHSPGAAAAAPSVSSIQPSHSYPDDRMREFFPHPGSAPPLPIGLLSEQPAAAPFVPMMPSPHEIQFINLLPPEARPAVDMDSPHRLYLKSGDLEFDIGVSPDLSRFFRASREGNRMTRLTPPEILLAQYVIEEDLTPRRVHKWQREAVNLDLDGSQEGDGLRIGKVVVNLEKLLKNLELEVKDSKGKTVLRRKNAPVELAQMLTKRRNSRQKFGQGTKDLYAKIVNLSGKGPKDSDIIIVKDPMSLVKRLQLGMGSIGSGNTSKKLRTEMMKIADFLLREKMMEKDDHKNIYQKLYV